MWADINAYDSALRDLVTKHQKIFRGWADMGSSRASHDAASDYAFLEPRIRHVSANKIKKKWKRLPPASQSCVRELLISLEQHAKQRHSLKKSANDAEVEDCVKQISEKLIERLPRMPFPPSAMDESFDFELNLHRIRCIEEQLASNTHAMNLLNKQIKHESQLLEEDKHEVATLEEGLRSNDTHRAKRLKSLHALARNMTLIDQASDAKSSACSTSDIISLDWKSLQSDITLQTHLAELHNHLDSIENNKESVEEVIMAMDKAKKSLLSVEFRQNARDRA